MTLQEKSVRTNTLEFPILSDAHNSIAAAFGLRFELPDYLVELYRKLKSDLPRSADFAATPRAETHFEC
jgi:hypothetical protein